MFLRVKKEPKFLVFPQTTFKATQAPLSVMAIFIPFWSSLNRFLRHLELFASKTWVRYASHSQSLHFKKQHFITLFTVI